MQRLGGAARSSQPTSVACASAQRIRPARQQATPCMLLPGGPTTGLWASPLMRWTRSGEPTKPLRAAAPTSSSCSACLRSTAPATLLPAQPSTSCAGAWQASRPRPWLCPPVSWPLCHPPHLAPLPCQRVEISHPDALVPRPDCSLQDVS